MARPQKGKDDSQKSREKTTDPAPTASSSAPPDPLDAAAKLRDVGNVIKEKLRVAVTTSEPNLGKAFGDMVAHNLTGLPVDTAIGTCKFIAMALGRNNRDITAAMEILVDFVVTMCGDILATVAADSNNNKNNANTTQSNRPDNANTNAAANTANDSTPANTSANSRASTATTRETNVQARSRSNSTKENNPPENSRNAPAAPEPTQPATNTNNPKNRTKANTNTAMEPTNTAPPASNTNNSRTGPTSTRSDSAQPSSPGHSTASEITTDGSTTHSGYRDRGNRSDQNSRTLLVRMQTSSDERELAEDLSSKGFNEPISISRATYRRHGEVQVSSAVFVVFEDQHSMEAARKGFSTWACNDTYRVETCHEGRQDNHRRKDNNQDKYARNGSRSWVRRRSRSMDAEAY